MNRRLPVIHESAALLQQQFALETHPQRRVRLHALYLLASRQARSRTALAHLLGVHRETVGVWLHRYETGGLPALLDIYVAMGRTPILSAEVRADLYTQLNQPQGFASYHAIQTWLLETHHVTIKYKTLHNLLRTKFKATPKVVRPSNGKKTTNRLRSSSSTSLTRSK